MGTGALVLAREILKYLDSHQTIGGIVSGTISGLITVLIASFFAKRFFNWYFKPVFKLELRDTTDKTHRLLLVNSIRQHFAADEVYLIILIDKYKWLKMQEREKLEKRPQIQIKEGKHGWIPLTCDTEEKNINKIRYVKLSMTIPQMLHPNSLTPVLIFQVTDIPLDIYYLFRTRLGSFPKNDSPRIIERGKLPKIRIY